MLALPNIKTIAVKQEWRGQITADDSPACTSHRFTINFQEPSLGFYAIGYWEQGSPSEPWQLRWATPTKTPHHRKSSWRMCVHKVPDALNIELHIEATCP
jgi:hypothetical protein